MTHLELAQSVRARHLPSLQIDRRNTHRDIGGIKITFPYHEDETGSFNGHDMDFVKSNYAACSSLMQPDSMPRPWIEFLGEVDAAKRREGTDYPTDLIYGVFRLSSQEPRYRDLGLPHIPITSFGWPDFRSKEVAKDAVERVLADDELRKKLKRMLAVTVADVGDGMLDISTVAEVLEGQGITSGVLLDLGCGFGARTPEWAAETGLTTIGIDRVHKGKLYERNWVRAPQQQDNLHFAQADFSKGLPFSEASVAAAVMEDVTPYVLEENLASSLREVEHVLMPQGLLFVGPQKTDNFVEWRFFRKEPTPEPRSYSLVEHPLGDLV